MARAPRTATRALLGRFVIALVISSLLMAGIVYGVNRGIDDRVASIERVKLVTAAAPPQGANYLIIGSDTRSGNDSPGDDEAFGDATTEGGQRSDTMMVAHVEPGSQRSVVVSFPRDLMVDVPGTSGKSMINTAYATGGPQLVIQTLEANFGIPINHYVEVDFKSFQAIVDAIGTVKIYVEGALRDQYSGFESIGAGCMPLDGPTALAYVRARHMEILDPTRGVLDPDTGLRWRALDANSDLDRIARQQRFVRQLAAVAIHRSLDDPFTAVKLSDEVLGYLKADQGFSRGDANALIRAFKTVDVNNTDAIQFLTIPTTTYRPDPNRLAVASDADSVLDLLRTFGNDAPVSPTVAPSAVKLEVRDGTATSFSAGVARALADQGFKAPIAGAVAPRDVAVSEIHYGADHADAAKTVLEFVPDAKLVPDKALDKTDKIELVLGRSFQSLTVPSTTAAPATAAGGAAVPTTKAAPSTTTTTKPPNSCPN